MQFKVVFDTKKKINNVVKTRYNKKWTISENIKNKNNHDENPHPA